MISKIIKITICALVISILVISCQTEIEQEISQLDKLENDIHKEKDKIKTTVEEIEKEIKRRYGKQVEQVIIKDRKSEEIILVEVKMQLGASWYILHNLQSEEEYLLPLEFSYVDSIDFINENYIVFNLTGLNSETSFIEPPYEIHFEKVVDDNGEFKFKGNKRKKYFSLDDSITFGDNIYDSYFVEDFRITLNGIQFSFMPDSADIDTVSFPSIETLPNKEKKQLILKMSNTKLHNMDLFKNLISEELNIYLQSVNVKDEGNSVYIIIDLKNDIKYYTVQINNGWFIEICFYNSK